MVELTFNSLTDTMREVFNAPDAEIGRNSDASSVIGWDFNRACNTDA